MDGEILGEIVGGLAEAAINSRDDDKKGCGCLIFIGIIAKIASIQFIQKHFLYYMIKKTILIMAGII